MTEPERYDLPVPGTARGERTRARLLASAEKVFGELGYDRASITAVTQDADVGQGTFYQYFPSKHAVFVELVVEFGGEVRRRLAAATASLGEVPRADLERAGLRAYFGFALEHPGLYSIVREAQFVAPATYRSYYEGFISAYVSHFDLPAVDAETIGWVIAGAADMLGLRWVVWQQRMPPDDVLDEVRDLLHAGFEGRSSRATVRAGRRGRRSR